MEESHYEHMEAGRELDALVAKKLFNLIRNGGRGVSPHDPRTHVTQDVDLPLPRYSTGIAAAWEVIDRLHELGFVSEVCIHRGQLTNVEYAVSVTVTGVHGHAYGGGGASAPLAICRAALWAVDKSK